MEGSSKKQKGLMDMDNNGVLAVGRDVKGINCNGKIQLKIKLKFLFFLIHSSTDGHLGCFQILAIVNSASMNIGVNTFF